MATLRLRTSLCTLAVAALLVACAAPGGGSGAATSSTPQNVMTMSLQGGDWVAFAISGAPEVLGNKPKLRWVAVDQIVGTGGCNGFKGRSSTNLASLQLGPLASTGRACLSMPGSQEDLFFKALELTRKARLERDQLILLDDSGKQLARLLRSN
jgi:heat shock protein HslJ